MTSKIIIDNIIYSLQKAGGISVYWTELLKRMLRDRLDLEIHEYANARDNLFRQELDISPNLIKTHDVLPLLLQRYLPLNVSWREGDLFHSSYYRPPLFHYGRNVVTVFDFTYEKYKSGLPRFIHSFQKKIALQAADGIICISHSTIKDLLDFIPSFPEDRIHVTHLGVSADFYQFSVVNERSEDLALAQIKQPYVVFVGERGGYKNFSMVVEAMKLLPDYHLVIVGGGGLTKELVPLQDNCAGRYSHVQGLSSKDLNIVYNHAHALLYPSLYEGFGIPVLEAMAAGCPVIATISSSLPEVAGQAGILIGDINAHEIAACVKSLEMHEKRVDQIALGLQNVQRFDWENCYQETLSFYRDILNKPKRNSYKLS